MFLDQRTYYLVLNDLPAGETRSVRIADSFEKAVVSWTPGSRLSPVWQVRGYNGATGFDGAETLLFLGPTPPAELLANVAGLARASDVGIWLTAGCFNVVVRLPGHDSSLLAELLIWVEAGQIAHEYWRLEDGAILSTQANTYVTENAQPIIDRLAASVARNDNAVLRPTFQEHVIVSATSLARAAAVYPKIFAKLYAVAEASDLTVKAYETGAIGVLEMQSRLLSMNAALSRFSSQAFSGIPPIQGTECHFWIHSLLGTGSANIALANLVDSIQQVLGDARIPDRLEMLAHKTTSVPDKMELVNEPKLLAFDIMTETEKDDVSDEAIIPLITYFSGRDGFSSQLQTLSAPLTTLAECNSFRSNLLTVTHEISHIFVQSALAVLSPSLGNDDEMNIAREIAAPHFAATNHLAAARQLLVEGIISMESAKQEFPDDQLDRRIPELFERWRTEMQEILVHAFDFLYFHQSEPEFYVTSIWHSWCSIPGIGDRVLEYLMRTLGAVAAQLLLTTDSSKLFDATLANTRDLLKKVTPNIDAANNYVEQALRLIERSTTDSAFYLQMQKDFAARLYLVRLVKIYLFSERLAARLFADPYARSTKAADEKKKLSYTTAPLGNALTFLKNQLEENPTEAESLWVLHCLAFDLRTPAGV
ncbi:MAG TPA: hypothetical protein VF503_19755 [Sphingobium sp.]|uniref:hypothetical protein n=1 Tax=Sphingobium sp. TaxID=1912891 RepID=UPI002ED23E31